MTVKIDVFHGECAAWFELVEKSAQSRAGITKVGKNKADINEIIPVIRLWLSCDILRPEVNIRNRLREGRSGLNRWRSALSGLLRHWTPTVILGRSGATTFKSPL